MTKLFTYLGIDIFLSDKPVSKTSWLLYRNEFWKDAIGHEGELRVSSMGRIIRLARHTEPVLDRKGYFLPEIMLKPYRGNNGYPRVKFKINRKKFHYLIHRLVGMAFVENPNGHPIINHKNGIRYDNNYMNLEWCTHKENIRHAFRIGLVKCKIGLTTHAKVWPKDLPVIKEMFESGISKAEIAAKYGLKGSSSYMSTLKKRCGAITPEERELISKIRYIREKHNGNTIGSRATSKEVGLHENTVAMIIKGKSYKNVK